MQGRKPTPTALKELRGNPGHRPLNKDEPQPRAGAPEMPEWLGDEEQQAWHWLVEELDVMGILTTADLAAMILFCDAWSDFMEGRRLCKCGGLVAVSKKTGNTYVPAWLNVKTGAWNRLLKCLSEFGLTSTSRTRLHTINRQPKGDQGARFVSRIVG